MFITYTYMMNYIFVTYLCMIKDMFIKYPCMINGCLLHTRTWCYIHLHDFEICFTTYSCMINGMFYIHVHDDFFTYTCMIKDMVFLYTRAWQKTNIVPCSLLKALVHRKCTTDFDTCIFFFLWMNDFYNVCYLCDLWKSNQIKEKQNIQMKRHGTL